MTSFLIKSLLGAFLLVLAPYLYAAEVSSYPVLRLDDPLPQFKPGELTKFQDAPLAQRGPIKPTFSIFSDNLPASQLIMLFYDQCEKKGLIFDPSTNKLDDVVRVKAQSLTCSNAKEMIYDAISRSGLAFESHGSYDVVKMVKPVDEHEGWEQFIFRPRFRDAVELADQCSIAIRRGSFAHQKRTGAVSAPVTPGSSSQQVPDTGSNGASVTSKAVENLIFYGPPSEVKAVHSLLQILDVPYSQVEISAGLYEYQAGTSTGSAVTAALKLFGSRLGVSVGGGSTSTSSGLSGAVSTSSSTSTNVYNTLSFATSNFSAVLSLLDEDSRFRSVSRPKVLARSGQQVVFTTGQDVMVPGPITINSSGQSLQSLMNVTAGVTFQVTPIVRGDAIDVNLHETVSDFVPSPNSNPSILKRDMVTDLMMRPGIVYVIGGLNTNSQTVSKQTLLGFKIGDQFTRNDTEIILLLTVKHDETGG